MDELPQSVPGPTLAAQRKAVGILQQDLAKEIGISRINLGAWERAAELDSIRAERYERALRALHAESLATQP